MEQERRRSTDQQLGYLTGKVEEIGRLLVQVDARAEALEKRVDEKFVTVETTFKILKWTAAFIGALLTFKFGDVAQLWEAFFK